MALEPVHELVIAQCRPEIRVSNGDAGKSRTAKKIEIHIGWRQRLRGRSIGHLANKTIPVFPSRIGGQHCSVIEGKELAPCVHGLRKTNRLADPEGDTGRIALKIVLGGKAVLLTEVVIDIGIGLVGVELARRPFYEGIESLAAAFGGGRVLGRNDEFPAWGLGLENRHRDAVHRASNACRTSGLTTSVICIHEGYKSVGITPICIGHTRKRRDAVERAAESIADTLALIRTEEEHFVLLDGPS